MFSRTNNQMELRIYWRKLKAFLKVNVLFFTQQNSKYFNKSLTVLDNDNFAVFAGRVE